MIFFLFQVEYEVKPCKSNGDGCVDVKKKSLMMPFNGYIVYGAAHQHAGGIGAALYREVTKVNSGFVFFSKLMAKRWIETEDFLCVVVDLIRTVRGFALRRQSMGMETSLGTKLVILLECRLVILKHR